MKRNARIDDDDTYDEDEDDGRQFVGVGDNSFLWWSMASTFCLLLKVNDYKRKGHKACDAGSNH